MSRTVLTFSAIFAVAGVVIYFTIPDAMEKITANFSPHLNTASRTESPPNRNFSANQLSPGKVNTTIDLCDGMTAPTFTKEPQKWQNVTDREVLVFAAYLEPRERADGPGIRIIANGLQEEFNNIGDIYCQLWYPGQVRPVAVGPAIYDRIYPSLCHGDMWVSHFIVCPLPRGAEGVPTHVSVTSSPCGKPSNQLLVLGRERPSEPKMDFAVCISALYNKFRNWSMVAEVFELQKILGADMITIYDYSASPAVHKVLDSFVADGSAEVVKWPYPEIKSNVFCQRGALNDCLYRNMYRARYVSIVDLDEIQIPRQTLYWKDFFAPHKSFPERGAFMFQHVYFRRNWDTTEDPALISQSSFFRTDEVTPAGRIRAKSIYEATKTKKIDLHFPYEMVEGYEEYLVPPEEGLLHHYRSYPMESFVKHPENYNFIEDRYLEQYKDKLVKAYKERIRSIPHLEN